MNNTEKALYEVMDQQNTLLRERLERAEGRIFTLSERLDRTRFSVTVVAVSVCINAIILAFVARSLWAAIK